MCKLGSPLPKQNWKLSILLIVASENRGVMASFVIKALMPIVLLVLSAALLLRALGDWNNLARTAAEPSPIATLGFTAEDSHGEPLKIDAEQSQRRAIVVFHGSEASRELEYWNKVRAGLPGSLKLIGICETVACSDLVMQRAGAPFPVILFGSYQATLSVLGQDMKGRVPVLDELGNIVASVPKQPKPEDMAADLSREASFERR